MGRNAPTDGRRHVARRRDRQREAHKRRKGRSAVLVDITKTAELPHPTEEGVVITVRPLRGTELDEAQSLKLQQTLELFGASMGTLAKTLQATNQEETLASRVSKYDVTTLLTYAITDWTYDRAVTSDAIRDLDGITREWLAEEVVSRNTRPLPRSKPGDETSRPGESLQS